MLQVIRDLFLRPSDGGGDLLRRKGTFLQEGEDLMPHGFRFHRVQDQGLLARSVELPRSIASWIRRSAMASTGHIL